MQFVGKERIMVTYGDGLANINIAKLLEFHESHGKLATLTAVRPPSRFGEINFKGEQVVGFREKPQVGEGWINGGFFVLEPDVADYIEGDDMPFERYPLETLSKEGQLMAYKHDGFWQPMDVIREMQYLEELWKKGNAPWKIWD
jgi:glucose-1-phosphate cytidylyltransferase